MKIAIRDHHHKSVGLAAKLGEYHQIVPLGQPADMLLIDHDATPYYRRIIDAYKATGAAIWLYPHGATAHLAWDGVWPVYDKVDGFLAMSKGQAMTMQAYGYPKPIRVTGWHWCELQPFKPWNKQGKPKVLFAPIHTLDNGYLHEDIRNMTRMVFERLAGMSGIELKVRYLGDLDACGVGRVSSVEYEKGNADNSITAIDTADFVVGFDTFAYLAVARGKPTMMYRQELPYFDAHSDDDVRYAENWESYGELIEYPVNVLDDNPFVKANAEANIKQWKDLFIGSQMNGDVFDA